MKTRMKTGRYMQKKNKKKFVDSKNYPIFLISRIRAYFENLPYFYKDLSSIKSKLSLMLNGSRIISFVEFCKGFLVDI